MNTGLRWILAFVLSLPLAATAAPLQLYVSPDGSDNAGGAINTPLASFTGARDRIRALRSTSDLSEGVVVTFAEGVYPVQEAVLFTPEDSGTEEAPIIFRAASNTEAIISGGRQINNWIREGAFWVTTVPEVRAGTWTFSNLWVNGDRRQPARTPNAANPWGDEPPDSDFFKAAGSVMVENKDTGKQVKSSTKFHYRDSDIQDWASLDDAIVITFHSWATSLMRLKSVDREQKILEFTGPARWAYGRWQPDQRYFIEHLFEGLDQPGEWYLNKKTGKLYYYPMPDEEIEEVEVVAPVTQQLLKLTGDAEAQSYVEHIRFEGLRFQHTAFPIAAAGHSDSQAAFKVNAAIELVGARHCAIENATLSHLGNHGVWFRRGSQHNVLRHCEITDLGAGGVRIGEGSSPETPEEATEYNVVDNNFIHEGGRVFRSAVGVWIGRSSYNDVTHNEICDFRYTGVSVGWSWGYAESSAHHNQIAYNHIHHIGRGQLNDMGAIYCLGVSPGTVLRGNLIHDVISHPRLYGGWGLYTDEGSTDILLEDNLVYNTTTGGFHQHYGRDNMIRNNIFAYSHGPQIIRTRDEDHNSFTFRNNIVYFNTGRTLGSNWKNGNYVMDNNVYWDTTGQVMDFSGRSFEEWRAQGNDQHSVVADPGFVDGPSGDFRLKKDALALTRGFKAFDFEKAGLYGDDSWVAKPKLITRPYFTPPPVPKPNEIHDGFETTAAGEKIFGASTNGEKGDARIRVSTNQARAGKQSLKFTDAAGLDKSYDPHLVYSPHIRGGVVHARFSLMAESGSIFYHEWRDSASPYQVGPSIWIDAQGNVKANGKQITQVPPGTWVDFYIQCALGRTARGTYDLEISTAGGTTQKIEGIACGSKKFRRLDWFGFVSNATVPVSVYLDDLNLDVAPASSTGKLELESVTKIWDAGGHNAFTGLVRWQDAWYCTFREADGHVKGNGSIRVIRSDDGLNWASCGLLREAGIDLRDPKLSVTPDDRLMISMGGSVYEGKNLVGRQPRSSFSGDGISWTTPVRVMNNGDWLWRVTWFEGKAYGVSYRSNLASDPSDMKWELDLVVSDDGIDFRSITLLDVPDRSNETTLRFMPDGECIAFVRREAGNRHAWIGSSWPPYTDWAWNESDSQVGGPEFIRLPDGRFIGGGRRYPGGAQMGIGSLTRENYTPELMFPSEGDCSYPSMVWHEDRLWVSYYSSHEGKTSIYLAKVRFDQ